MRMVRLACARDSSAAGARHAPYSATARCRSRICTPASRESSSHAASRSAPAGGSSGLALRVERARCCRHSHRVRADGSRPYSRLYSASSPASLGRSARASAARTRPWWPLDPAHLEGVTVLLLGQRDTQQRQQAGEDPLSVAPSPSSAIHSALPYSACHSRPPHQRGPRG